MRTLLFSCLFATSALTLQAKVTLPSLFTDHLILQREKPVPVWGWAEPGEAVTVAFGGQSLRTQADVRGQWRVSLTPLKAESQPQDLTVSGQNIVVIKDVLVGEVWLCSGQSNMGLSVNGALNAEQEKEKATDPRIRMMFVQSFTALSPQEQCRGVWQAASPQTIGNFSAAAYFFGRELRQSLKVPIGLINSSVGGTPIESWTSMQAMQGNAALQPLLKQAEQAVALFESPETKAKNEASDKQWREDSKKALAEKLPPPRHPAVVGLDPLNPNHPATLFNGKIAPLIPFAIRGAIWYQGESNASNGALYATQMPLLIKDWRTRWGYDFPFAWVQLPNFMRRETSPSAPSNWARLREAQTQALAMPGTGMTINLDIGEMGNIHPRNKQEIGRRLSLWARAKVYGEKIPFSGPMYERSEIKGAEVIIHFQHADGGLKTTDGSSEVKGFAVADDKHNWKWAKARIEGNTIIVSSPEMQAPRAVRHAWANNPEVNLVNGAGLPAGPFRTDDWAMDNLSMPVK